jgi:hypothetical protein
MRWALISAELFFLCGSKDNQRDAAEEVARLPGWLARGMREK